MAWHLLASVGQLNSPYCSDYDLIILLPEEEEYHHKICWSINRDVILEKFDYIPLELMWKPLHDQHVHLKNQWASFIPRIYCPISKDVPIILTNRINWLYPRYTVSFSLLMSAPPLSVVILTCFSSIGFHPWSIQDAAMPLVFQIFSRFVFSWKSKTVEEGEHFLWKYKSVRSSTRKAKNRW